MGAGGVVVGFGGGGTDELDHSDQLGAGEVVGAGVLDVVVGGGGGAEVVDQTDQD